VKIIQQFSSRFSKVMGKQRIKNVIKLKRRTVVQDTNSTRWLMVCPKVNHKTTVKKLVIQHYVPVNHHPHQVPLRRHLLIHHLKAQVRVRVYHLLSVQVNHVRQTIRLVQVNHYPLVPVNHHPCLLLLLPLLQLIR